MLFGGAEENPFAAACPEPAEGLRINFSSPQRDVVKVNYDILSFELVELRRIELLTPALQTRCSSQLSYSPTVMKKTISRREHNRLLFMRSDPREDPRSN